MRQNEGKSAVEGNRRILMSANGAWALSNYRLGLVKAMIDAGFEVHAAVPDGPGIDQLCEAGAVVHCLPMQPRGMSPVADGRLLFRYARLIRDLRPTAFLGFTIKPNIYGSIAARLFHVRTINNITGLGTIFVTRSAATRLVIALYRLALTRSHTVFFQNGDDAQTFVTDGLVDAAQVRRLPGSGIDLNRFSPRPKGADGSVTFLLAGRLLWEKGVREFVEAAAQVRQSHPHALFQILGFIEPAGKGAVARADVDRWVTEGTIEYLGSTDDVRTAMASADCVTLPSYYREGVPRTLLEAAAMELPVITADMPGCRDAVEHGRTGFLCQPRSAESLAEAIEHVLSLSPAERQALGAAGRAKMQQEFDEIIVHRAYLRALSEADR